MNCFSPLKPSAPGLNISVSLLTIKLDAGKRRPRCHHYRQCQVDVKYSERSKEILVEHSIWPSVGRVAKTIEQLQAKIVASFGPCI